MLVDYAGAEVEWVTGTITLLELVKTRLEITGTDQDAELSMYISMAGAACEKYIDNKLVLQSVTEYVACRNSFISLRYWPVISLESITVGEIDITPDCQLITSDGVTWVVDTYMADVRSLVGQQTTITYTAGFDPLPGAVGYAIASTALNYVNQTAAVGAIKKEVIQGVGSVEYVTGETSEGAVGLIPGSAVGVMEMYRRWHV